MSVRFFSSVGKKEWVAVTGLLWLGFLAGHLLGNTSIWFGAASFDSYAEHLHGLGIILSFMEIGLAATFLTHVALALWVTVENFLARPIRYQAGRKGKGGWASKLMPYTGLYMLGFVIVHLANFRMDRGVVKDSVNAAELFSIPAWTAFYAFSTAVVAFHVTHALWSCFQTLDIGMTGRRNHLLIRRASLVYSLIVGFGFGLIPVVIFFAPDLLR